MALTLRSKGPEIYFWEWGDEGENLEQAGPWLPPGQACAPGKDKSIRAASASGRPCLQARRGGWWH